ncbi:unnamed protein product, partial [Anisakis simplex]|uniref:Secreted protein n=1 Tax=Anisakis simplex TaxID=6269 RepID=A0A0M3J412_ANISI
MACPVICTNQLESIIVFWLMLCFNVDSVSCYPAATATQPSSSGSNNSSNTVDDNSD